MPVHVLQNDERYYERAAEFVPERWAAERSKMIKDKRAYAPFSLGTYACPGKGLVMMELRMAIARVVLSFDIGFAEGEDGRRLEEETKETITLSVPSMMAKFTVRR